MVNKINGILLISTKGDTKMSWTINKSGDDDVYKLADEYAEIKENIARLQIRLDSVRKDLYSKMKTKDIETIENEVGRISMFTRACAFKRELNKEFKGLAYDDQDEIARVKKMIKDIVEKLRKGYQRLLGFETSS